MRTELYIVGTIHNPTEDLETVVRAIQPTQLLLEIVDDDIRQEALDDQLPDMVAMYHLAKAQGIAVRGIDMRIEIINPKATQEDFLYAERVGREHATLGFQELNQRAYDIVWESIAKRALNPQAHKQRQSTMVENIRQMRTTGKNLLFCGTGHLQYFEKNVPDAIFPFR